MFEKLFEKRSEGINPFDWTKWVKGEDDEIIRASQDETYQRCINLLGDSVGKLNVEIKQETEKGEEIRYEHYLYEKLRLRPNNSMSSFIVFSTLVKLYKHKGIAGIYIDRNIYDGKIKGLYPVKIDNIFVDDAGIIESNKNNKILIDFTCYEYNGSCFEKDIILIRDNSFDGIKGNSINRSLKNTIDSNVGAKKYQSQLFKNGLTNKAVVQLTTDLKDENDIKKIQNKFNKIYSNNGRIFTVPAGFNISPLNLNLVDSQFAELKDSGKKDVASTIGIPYSFVNDMKDIKDEEILAFISNTIFPIITQIEQEMDWKLLSYDERKNKYKIRFNINAALRSTPKAQQEIICNYVKQGVYSLNYGRKLAGSPLLDKDVTVFPSGQVTLDQLIKGKVSYIDDKGGDEGEDK